MLFTLANFEDFLFGSVYVQIKYDIIALEWNLLKKRDPGESEDIGRSLQEHTVFLEADHWWGERIVNIWRCSW